MSGTLCWTCGRAYGGCSWSRYKVQKPVPGWIAERRDIRIAAELPMVESYLVIDCPLYIADRSEDNCWTPEMYDRLIALRRSGASVGEISAALSRTPRAVYNQIYYMKKRGTEK